MSGTHKEEKNRGGETLIAVFPTCDEVGKHLKLILYCLTPLFFTGRGDHPRDARTGASSLQRVDPAAGPVHSRTWVMMTTACRRGSSFWLRGRL